MGQTLENGVYLPSEGERNCYAGLKTNWEILDQKVAEVTALQQAVAGALHREIVESLPTTDIDPNTIYMILSGTSATENVYNEYMYVNNAWELIGTSATDLTNYYTKAEVDGKLLLKANDSDVVHKSGNETVSGAKTFSDNLTIYNSDDTQTPKGLAIRNAQWVMGESGGTAVSNINFLDKNTSIPVSIMASKGLSGQTYLRFNVRTKDSQNTIYGEEIYYDIDTSGNVEFRSWHDNTISLGTSAYKWKDVQTKLINGLTPSSLGMPVAPSSTSYVDISSYITVLDSSVPNTYTPPSNGYITFSVTGNLVQIFHDYGLQGKWSVQAGNVNRGFIPVLGGVEVKIYINASSIDKFWFIPCQGNV